MKKEVYDFNRTLIENLSEKLRRLEILERPFEYYEEELEEGIIALKEAYSKRAYDSVKKIQIDIINLVKKLEEKVETPQQIERTRKLLNECSTYVEEMANNELETYKSLKGIKSVDILELNEEKFIKEDDKVGDPELVYTYNKIINFIDGFSDYISEKLIKFYNPKDSNFTESYVKEGLNQDFDILQKLKSVFSFLPDRFFTEEKDTEILNKDPNLLSGLELEQRIVAANHLKRDLREVRQCFYQEIVKEVFTSNAFPKKKFGMSKNEVYEIDDPFLNETLIIKKSKDNNLKSEKEIIDHYKFYSSEMAMLFCLCIAVNNPVPIESERELQKSLGGFFNIDLVEVVSFGIYKNEQYLFLKRKKGLNLLEYLENLKKIKITITDTTMDTLVNFRYCLKSLANLNAHIPPRLNKEFIKGDYKKEIQGVLLRFEKDLDRKFSEQFRNEFLKNYETIDFVLSSAPKSLYKDAYLKNWIIDNSKLSDKKNQGGDLKITPIDFERCAIAPVQIDLAFLLDFGNFIEDKERDELIDYYIGCANHFKHNPNWISDTKEFKRIFDYACVHRNLLTFRSYSRFIEEGDNSEEAKYYKKTSLENSIKALQKLINYEKENVDKLKAVCNDLKNVYYKIYR